MKWFALTLALFFFTGCSCDEEFEYLSLAMGSEASPAPKSWDETWTLPEPASISATAVWGPEDPAPYEGAFELWRQEGEVSEQLDLETADCSTEVTPRTGPCKNFDYGGSCPYRGRTWTSETLESGTSYALVFRRHLGNGKQLNMPGTPEAFAGSPGLVMEIVVE